MTVILAATLTVPGEAELKARLPDIFAKSAAHNRIYAGCFLYREFLLWASNANLMFDGSGLTPEALGATFRVFAKKGEMRTVPRCSLAFRGKKAVLFKRSRLHLEVHTNRRPLRFQVERRGTSGAVRKISRGSLFG